MSTHRSGGPVVIGTTRGGRARMQPWAPCDRRRVRSPRSPPHMSDGLARASGMGLPRRRRWNHRRRHGVPGGSRGLPVSGDHGGEDHPAEEAQCRFTKARAGPSARSSRWRSRPPSWREPAALMALPGGGAGAFGRSRHRARGCRRRRSVSQRTLGIRQTLYDGDVGCDCDRRRFGWAHGGGNRSASRGVDARAGGRSAWWSGSVDRARWLLVQPGRPRLLPGR